MKTEELFEKRLLRKIPKDGEKIKSSLRVAETKLEEAKRLFSAEFFGNSLLNVYTTMFHLGRAILYNEGIQEKSHYAVYVYLRENFSKKIPLELLNVFNRLREERHEILYGFEENISEKMVEESILDAEAFVEEVKKILELE